jgi:ATP/maltotriose-dependent transcriptional regulator MalT
VLVKLILEPFRKKADSKIKREKLENFGNEESIGNNRQLDFSVLSKREKEVAKLAAQKYTNAQIAEELFISQETVKRHLSTIFEKLDISSRKDLEIFRDFE